MDTILYLTKRLKGRIVIMYKHSFLFIIIFLLCGMRLFAQTGEEIRNHIIIAIDERIGSNWKPEGAEIRDKVELYLFEPITITHYSNSLNNEKIDTLYGGQPLFKEGDHLSIVTFSLGQKDKTIEDFSAISSYGGTQYKFVPFSEELKKTIHDQWSNLVKRRELHEVRHSIFSIAIPQVLAKCKRTEDNHLTNRTFVIVITDRAYSDKTYFDDIRDFTDQQFLKTGGHAIKKSDIIGISQIVSKDYFINWINQDEKKYQFWDLGYNRRTKNVDLYELEPLQENLRMPAVVRYPEQIVAKRGRFGMYSIDLSIQPEDRERFNVLRLEASLKGTNKRGEKLNAGLVSYAAESADTPFPGIGSKDGPLNYVLGKNKSFDHIEMRVWANLKDGLYNATVLTPSKDAAAYLGKNGLNVNIPIVYEPKAKTAFGLLPLWDIFCFTGNQGLDATLVNLLIIALLIAALFYWIHRTRYYEPTVDEITTQYKNRE